MGIFVIAGIVVIIYQLERLNHKIRHLGEIETSLCDIKTEIREIKGSDIPSEIAKEIIHSIKWEKRKAKIEAIDPRDLTLDDLD